MFDNEDHYIRKIKIDGLFGEKSLRSIDMDESVNCIYGANGSGKTTIINLLVAALACDAKRLSNIKFKSLSVLISKSKQKRVIKFFTLTKAINGEMQYEFPNVTTFSIHASGGELNTGNLNNARTLIDEKVTVNYLPLNRVNETEIHDSYREREMLLRSFARGREADSDEFELFFDPIRRMLINLERRFKDEYSKKQRAIRNDLESLKEKVLEKFLIDDDLFKKVNATSLQKVKVTKEDYKTVKQKLEDIGLNLPIDKLEKHFTLMAKITEELSSKQAAYASYSSALEKDDETEKKIISEYSTSLRAYRSLNPFHDRLMSIISDVEKSTIYRQVQLKLFKSFQTAINAFLVNKSFEFTEVGGFSFLCRGVPVKLEELSSGEKHILALLGKVALSPAASSIFIADEPELSLHLSWQRKLLPALQDLSPNMQIIVATHAPAIIPSYANKIDLDELSNDMSTI